jgi:hypothetical protein
MRTTRGPQDYECDLRQALISRKHDIIVDWHWSRLRAMRDM